VRRSASLVRPAEWLKRFQAGGVSAVRERSRRPDVPKQSVKDVPKLDS
jgi:hypothetical protein